MFDCCVVPVRHMLQLLESREQIIYLKTTKPDAYDALHPNNNPLNVAFSRLVGYRSTTTRPNII